MPRAGRIVHITEAFTGGVRTHLCQLLRGLPDWEQILIASPCRDRRAPEVMEALGSEGFQVIRTPMVRHLSPTLDLAGLAALVYYLHRLRPDIVHAHSAKAGFLGRLAGWLAGVPVRLYTPHGIPFHQEVGPLQKTIYRRLERLAGHWTTGIIAVSSSESYEILTAGVAPSEKVWMIPNGVELPGVDRNSTEAREELGLETARPVVLTVGALRRQKAPLDWLRMAEEVLRVKPDTLFVWAGGDVLSRSANERVRRAAAKLGDSLRFTGFLADPGPAYQAATLFTLASRWEGCPYSLLEGMSWGLPSAVTRVSGSRDVIVHGYNGLLSSPGEPHGLAVNVLRLLQNPGEAAQMGQRARQTVQRYYSLAEFLQRYNELYTLLRR